MLNGSGIDFLCLVMLLCQVASTCTLCVIGRAKDKPVGGHPHAVMAATTWGSTVDDDLDLC